MSANNFVKRIIQNKFFSIFLFLVFSSAIFFYFFINSEKPQPLIQVSDTKIQNILPITTTTVKPSVKKIDLGKFKQSAYGKFQMGDYEGAVKQLRKEYSENPTENTKQNLATSLFALAFLRFRQDNIQDAEAFLEESAKLGNQDAQLSLAGIKLKQGDVDFADAILNELLDKTQNTSTIQTLIDLALSRDNLDKARFLLTKLESNILTNKLEETSVEYNFYKTRKERLETKQTYDRNAEFVELGSVIVYYPSKSQRKIAESLSQTIDKTLNEISWLLGKISGEYRIKALLIESNDFQAATGAPPWAGAIFDGLIRVPVPTGEINSGFIPIINRLVQHETLHAYLYSFCGDNIPAWLGEGLAQKVEGKRPEGYLNLFKVKYGRNMEKLPVLAALDSTFANSPAEEIPELYARSLFMVEYLSKLNEGIIVNLLSNTCLRKVSFTRSLHDELGVYDANALWELVWSKTLK